MDCDSFSLYNCFLFFKKTYDNTQAQAGMASSLILYNVKLASVVRLQL
jgi:hypothetical protein